MPPASRRGWRHSLTPGEASHGHGARGTTMRLVVVGGGTAGMAAALQARELGADVALLEADEVGGTTLNRGPARQ